MRFFFKTLGAALALSATPVVEGRSWPLHPRDLSSSSSSSYASSAASQFSYTAPFSVPSSSVSSPAPLSSSYSSSLSAPPSMSDSSSVSDSSSLPTSSSPSASVSLPVPASASSPVPPSSSTGPKHCTNLIANPSFVSDGNQTVPNWTMIQPAESGSRRYGPLLGSPCGGLPNDPKTCYEYTFMNGEGQNANYISDRFFVIPGETYKLEMAYRTTYYTDSISFQTILNNDIVGLPALQVVNYSDVKSGWQVRRAVWTAPKTDTFSYLAGQAQFTLSINGAATQGNVYLQFSNVYVSGPTTGDCPNGFNI